MLHTILQPRKSIFMTGTLSYFLKHAPFNDHKKKGDCYVIVKQQQWSSLSWLMNTKMVYGRLWRGGWPTES
jgi:hypothetical protein